MTSTERTWIAIILMTIIVMVATDLTTDFSQGVRGWHVFLEGSIVSGALMGIFLLLRGSFALKRLLSEEKQVSFRLQTESDEWRAQSKKYIAGLSQAIDDQLTAWQLTDAEKEVAFLLLKGLSLKEIAEIRKTAEKTTRAQSVVVYSKAQLNGRSELAAFFLEDLLPPSQTR